MRNILIVSSYSVHLKRFLLGLQSLNIDYYLITNKKPDFVEASKCLIVNFSFFSIFSIMKMVIKFIRLRPKVIHIHQANSVAFNAIIAKSISFIKSKIILTTWGSDILILPHKTFLLNCIVKFNLMASDIITADAQHILNEIMRITKYKLDNDFLKLINFGVNIIPFDHDIISSKEDIILSVRLHKKLYNIDKIIVAFNEAMTKRLIPASYKLIIVAAGEESHSLKLLAKSCKYANKIKFTGMIDFQQLVEYYKAAKIMVSIPSSDASSSSLLEAMLYGCIPVVSNLEANQEWIHHANNGFLCSLKNNINMNLIEALQSACVIGSNQQKLQCIYNKNYNIVATKANYKHNMKKFVQIYQVML
jgi:glycosyltransferase involved in cell wall biosynthesis